MRFGAPLFEPYAGPGEWTRLLQQYGYRAAYCPVGADATESEIAAYRAAAASADILIAEVGVWNNPFSGPEAIETCKERLAFADRIGARCCVNIVGSRGDLWDGPHPDNLSDETFDAVVEITRGIIDAVRPSRAKYAIETMPWMLPYDAESSLRLARAIDREAFGIHFDPVNIVNSPLIFYRTDELVRDFVDHVGPHIAAVHVKDIALSGKLTVHLDEVRVGLGGFDHRALIRAMRKLPDDTPALLEHLTSADEYRQAAESFQAAARAVDTER